MKQIFKGKISGQVAGGDIYNHTTINQAVGGNVIHGDFHNHGALIIQAAPAQKQKVKVVVSTGPEHVSEEQKVKLKELVTEVVRLESLLRREPKSFASVWAAVNGKLRVSSYKLMLGADYPKAEKYLREWIGRLSSAKSAPKKDANWRNRKYSYIFTNAKQLGAEAMLRERLQERYGSDSMKDLSDEHLEAVYQLVAGWKKTGRAPGQAPA